MTGLSRDEVLAWAERARLRRAEIVAGVTAGSISLAEVLAGRSDPLTGPIKVVVVAQAVPGVGKVAARRVLSTHGLDGARLADLDDQTCAALIEAVEAANDSQPRRPTTR